MMTVRCKQFHTEAVDRPEKGAIECLNHIERKMGLENLLPGALLDFIRGAIGVGHHNQLRQTIDRLRTAMVEIELRVQCVRQAEQTELSLRCAERMRRQGIKPELDTATCHEQSAQFLLRRFLFPQLVQSECALPPGFIIDDPKLRKTNSRAAALSAREDQVDAAAHPQRFTGAQRYVRR